MTSNIRNAVLIFLEDHNGEVAGTEQLALCMGVSNKPWLVKQVRIAQLNGQIQIIPSRGGRGHKTVYKRNRNQPGLPRNTR